MRLKSLELFGFKSFVDRTLIHFEKGVNGIVGPNGCGKSNVVDAIRWVMGEQSAKHLRGEAMQDVIFNGTSTRSPLGMSQVVLTLAVDPLKAPVGFQDYPEIQVERRLYRSGESEYYLNKVPCRLRDILDLFLGTGVGTKAYSMIEQGRIDRILAAKPEERRFIIEEAAGISKFKHRKEAALRRMESTEANLARLRDVVAEIKRQLNALNRQAKRAKDYREIFEELKTLELCLASTRYQKFKNEVERLEADNVTFTQTETSLSALLAQLETGNEEKRLALVEKEQALSAIQEKFYKLQNEIKLHEAALEYQKDKSKSLLSQTEKEAEEIEIARTRLETCEKEIDHLNNSQIAADVVLAGVQEKIKEVEVAVFEATQVYDRSEEELENCNSELLKIVTQIAAFQSRLEYLGKKEIELEGRIGKGQGEIDAIDKILLELDDKFGRIEEDLKGLKQLHLKLGDDRQRLQTELETKRHVLEEAVLRLEAAKNDFATKNSRYLSLKEIHQNMEGLSEGVRHVLQAKGGALQGVFGPVSDCVDTEPLYEKAVSAVLGEKLQYVVVQSSLAGLEAVEYLKQQTKGRSTFVPLNLETKELQSAPLKAPGVLGNLIDKVHFTDDYKKIAHYLLGDCVLVEDFRAALDLWHDPRSDGKTFVTLQGDVLSSNGVVSGGGSLETSSRLGHKRRLEELEKEMNQAQSLLKNTEGEVWELKKEVQKLEETWERLNRSCHGEEIRYIHQEKDVARIAEEKGRLAEDRDRFALQIGQALDEKRELLEERKKVALDLEGVLLKQRELEGVLKECQERRAAISLKKDQSHAAFQKVKMDSATAEEKAVTTERELNRAIERKVELQEGIEKHLQNIRMAKTQMQELLRAGERERMQWEEALKEMDQFKEKQEELRLEYENLQKSIQEKEIDLRAERSRHEETVQKLHANELHLTQNRHQLETLADQMFERYKVDVASLMTRDVSEEKFDEELQKIATLKNKLEKLGSVHVGAIEEYDELKQRYDFLSKQEEDLVQSLEDLKKAIQKINRLSRDRFLTTFEQVNKTFQEVFPRLFKGGRAKLILVDENNLLETGVEVYAQPPGKKLQLLSLLSGGEKALTAVALIFSLFLNKPSPFCILDEVDAPLDDANVDRFNECLREMTSHSQFIVITHSKQTMEKCDCLYGVTMEEAGISKIVSVRLKESEQQALSQVA